MRRNARANENQQGVWLSDPLFARPEDEPHFEVQADLEVQFHHIGV